MSPPRQRVNPGDDPRFPGWRVGFASARVRTFLAGVIGSVGSHPPFGPSRLTPGRNGGFGRSGRSRAGKPDLRHGRPRARADAEPDLLACRDVRGVKLEYAVDSPGRGIAEHEATANCRTGELRVA